MNRPLITPQTLKGFRDYLPAPAMAREALLEIARRVYRSYGFSPIDTPALTREPEPLNGEFSGSYPSIMGPSA